ncbi:hypothetical protein FOZ62_030515 [Perkinsus olseni]|uniref:E3 ubiquitin-protein ligase herc2 n=1 Tax=Perkinsus olseni TaxID=32597 RepID=A0A7J6RGP5_PEROL|nr:hypothetical protein FOZ62_030515 [Perkinsus olseni]
MHAPRCCRQRVLRTPTSSLSAKAAGTATEIEHLVNRVSGGASLSDVDTPGSATWQTYLRDRSAILELIKVSSAATGPRIAHLSCGACYLRRLQEPGSYLGYSWPSRKGLTLCTVMCRFTDFAELQGISESAQILGENPRRVVDAYEFVAVSILLAARLSLEDKLQLLFKLFHFNTNNKGLSRGELSLLLRSVTRAVAKFHRSLGTTAIDADIPKNLAVDDFAKDVLEQWGTKNGLLTRRNLCRWAGTDGTALRYQCGVGIGDPPTIDTRPIPLLSMDSVEVVKIAAGESHSLFLDCDGRLFACGSGFCGILGMGNTLDCTTPKLVPFAPQDRESSSNLGRVKVIDIATAIRHSVAVTDSGHVYCWGNNDVDQLGLAIEESQEACLERAYDHRTGGTFTYATRPTLIGSLKRQGIRASMVGCTNFSTVVVTDDDRIFAWGLNSRGQCGVASKEGELCMERCVHLEEHIAPECAVRTIPIPAEINFKRFDGANYPPPENSREGGETAREGHGPPGKIISLACGAAHIIAIDDGHNAWAWGDNSSGQLAHSSPEPYSHHPQLISSLSGLCVKAAAGKSTTMLMTSLLRWGIHSGITASLHNRVAIDSPYSGGTRMGGLPTVYGLPLAGATEWSAIPRNRPARSTPLVCIEDSPKDYGTSTSVMTAMNPVPTLRQSVVLVDRGLSEGTWLKLSSSGGGFRIHPLNGGTTIFDRPNAIPDHSPAAASNAAIGVELMAPRGLLGGATVTTTDLTLPHDTLPADFFTGCISTTDGRRLIELMKAAELDGTPPRAAGEDIQNLRTEKVSDSELLPASGDTKAHPGRTQVVGGMKGRGTHVLSETGEGCPALPPLIFPRNEWSSAHLISVRYDPFREEKLVNIASYKPSAILIAQSEEKIHVEAFKLPQGLERGDCPIAVVSHTDGKTIRAAAGQAKVHGGELLVTPDRHRSVPSPAEDGNDLGGSADGKPIELDSSVPHPTASGSEHSSVGAFVELDTEECGLFVFGKGSHHTPEGWYVAELHGKRLRDIAAEDELCRAVSIGGEVFHWRAGATRTSQERFPPSDAGCAEAYEVKKLFAGTRHSFLLADAANGDQYRRLLSSMA